MAQCHAIPGHVGLTGPYALATNQIGKIALPVKAGDNPSLHFYYKGRRVLYKGRPVLASPPIAEG